MDCSHLVRLSSVFNKLAQQYGVGAEGETCTKCHDYYPYAQANGNEPFVCTKCRLQEEIFGGGNKHKEEKAPQNFDSEMQNSEIQGIADEIRDQLKVMQVHGDRESAFRAHGFDVYIECSTSSDTTIIKIGDWNETIISEVYVNTTHEEIVKDIINRLADWNISGNSGVDT